MMRVEPSRRQLSLSRFTTDKQTNRHTLWVGAFDSAQGARKFGLCVELAQVEPHSFLARMSLTLSEAIENTDGWGPAPVAPEKFKDAPFTIFRKDDRLGRVADWTMTPSYGQRYQSKNLILPYLLI